MPLIDLCIFFLFSTDKQLFKAHYKKKQTNKKQKLD